MFFHLVQADCELPNDNPALSDPCGVLALLQAFLAQAEVAVDPAVEVAAGVGIEGESGAQCSASGYVEVAVEDVPLAVSSEPATVREGARLSEEDQDEDADDDHDEIEVVDELPPMEFEIAELEIANAATASDASADDPFATFVRTLVAVAQDAGCARAAALLPALLEEGQVDASAFGAATLEGLVGAGVLDRGAAGFVGGEGFRRTAKAWRAILRGDSDDFAACGPRMLDEWAADLVARILAAPAKTEQLRRELRTRGVAAFGLVMAA